jgi:hypothetical protein
MLLMAYCRRSHRRDLGPDESRRDRNMKTLKNIFLILCVLSLCSKVTLHTYRHFHPAAVTAAAR